MPTQDEINKQIYEMIGSHPGNLSLTHHYSDDPWKNFGANALLGPALMGMRAPGPSGAVAARMNPNLDVAPSHQWALDWLNQRQPATLESTKDYLNQLGIQHRISPSPVNPVARGTMTPTDYLTMEDPYATESGLTEFQRQMRGIPRPYVRFPSDQHIGQAKSSISEGSMFDTGMELPGGARRIRDVAGLRQFPGTLINEEGVPFSNKSALEKALQWRFSRAPDNGNWLTSPQDAPYGKGFPKEPRPQPNPTPQPNPDQLVLDFLSRAQ